MKKYQITEYADWFNQKELIEIIKKLKTDEKIEVVRLNEGSKRKNDN